MRLKGFLTRLDSLAIKVKPALEAQLLARRLAAVHDHRDGGPNEEQEEQKNADGVLLWALFTVTVSLCEDSIGREDDSDETQIVFKQVQRELERKAK
ncbi:hypothetical protein B0T25DRAFT_563194 [Lasiosphaeria hispida]|uniref:Uncharacterized protein n=1 Tax=Lasiosphaeria hispida TaxID=260671 RepID=A0AAJ0HWV5_9PEZI|nr:hypothetical protein B0T25DRAFT_563194 [Lasiosphaeria hispida]